MKKELIVIASLWFVNLHAAQPHFYQDNRPAQNQYHDASHPFDPSYDMNKNPSYDSSRSNYYYQQNPNYDQQRQDYNRGYQDNSGQNPQYSQPNMDQNMNPNYQDNYYPQQNPGQLSDASHQSRDSKAMNKEQKEFPQDRYASPEDMRLNKAIRDEISRGWLWDSYKDISLNTVNGIVNVEGTVNNAKDEEKIIKKIQKIEGVRSVNSHLQVKNK